MKNLEIKKLKIKINNLGLRVPITSFYKKHGGGLPLWRFLKRSST
jgi:hypothetical protein